MFTLVLMLSFTNLEEFRDPQIHLEQEDPLNLDKENVKIEESVPNLLNANSKSNKTSISAL